VVPVQESGSIPANLSKVGDLQMRITGILAFIVLYSTVSAGTDDQKPRSTYSLEEIEGTYTGTLLGSGYDMPVVTTFYYEDGILCGEYIMDEEGTMTPGQLSNITFTQNRTIECRWTDKYGSGPASFTFTDNFSGFAGYWSSEGAVGYYWWGSREPLEEIRQTILN
jgi:hypothetical protein